MIKKYSYSSALHTQNVESIGGGGQLRGLKVLYVGDSYKDFSELLYTQLSQSTAWKMFRALNDFLNHKVLLQDLPNRSFENNASAVICLSKWLKDDISVFIFIYIAFTFTALSESGFHRFLLCVGYLESIYLSTQPIVTIFLWLTGYRCSWQS